MRTMRAFAAFRTSFKKTVKLSYKMRPRQPMGFNKIASFKKLTNSVKNYNLNQNMLRPKLRHDMFTSTKPVLDP
jgi:hypothetical protein